MYSVGGVLTAVSHSPSSDEAQGLADVHIWPVRAGTPNAYKINRDDGTKAGSAGVLVL